MWTMLGNELKLRFFFNEEILLVSKNINKTTSTKKKYAQ